MAEIKYINEEKIYRQNPVLKEAEELTDRLDEALDILTGDKEADDITKYKADKAWKENKEAYMQAILTISGTEERSQRRERYLKMVEEEKNRKKFTTVK